LTAFFKSTGVGGWTEFTKKYSESAGWIEFSAVGFNQDKTIAVLYVAHHCGSLCGGGVVRAFQKFNGKWLPRRWEGQWCDWQS
jgi:hypothetical protein